MSVPTVVQSNQIPFALSSDGPTFATYKNVVCKKAWNFTGTTTINTDESDCGIHTGLGANTWTLDFEAILNTTPDGATEISAGAMLALWAAQTLVAIKVMYPNPAGTAFYVQGTAYITTFSLVNQVGNLMTFTGTLTGASAVDVTP